ncbi:MAG: 30S ribosomal protein S16 [Ignavibacteriae bacterium HGW-Ignavibacteriae-2]|nr:MAG: 30S ribosomal protein S16 [Ignavibacteriae bacterium HGW-Ignavibacteriae-2]
MAVKLRLKRMGKKRQPVYKVVAADARSPRDGKFIEAIGLYNPKTDPVTIDIKEDRALYWLGVGAQPTDTVKNLLSKQGILLRKQLVKSGLTEEQVEAKLAEWKNAQEAKLAGAVKKQDKSKKSEPGKEAKVEQSASEVKGATSDEA